MKVKLNVRISALIFVGLAILFWICLLLSRPQILTGSTNKITEVVIFFYNSSRYGFVEGKEIQLFTANDKEIIDDLIKTIIGMQIQFYITPREYERIETDWYFRMIFSMKMKRKIY